MIVVDWGTSGFRAWRVRGGSIAERRESGRGILNVAPGGFPAALRDEIGIWLDADDNRVLISGMAGSRQGWVEAPYVECPAGPDDLAAALAWAPFEGAAVRIVPGVRGTDPTGVPEVMRGEETQVVGVLDRIGAGGTACLPGTHSKWVTVQNGRIAAFQTHMTGEAFAALRGHTILGRMMQDAPPSPDAFRSGVIRARDGGGLLHHLFGVRTLGLFAKLPETEAASYLSGLLIGHEIAAAAPTGIVHLIGSPALCQLYVSALDVFGVQGEVARADAAAAGLMRIAERDIWT